jgi:hypothetical protein
MPETYKDIDLFGEFASNEDYFERNNEEITHRQENMGRFAVAQLGQLRLF